MAVQLVFCGMFQVRRNRHAEDSWRSRDELIRDLLLWTPSNGRAGVGRPARNYLQMFRADTGCSLEDLLKAKDKRGREREWVGGIRVSGMT